MKTKIINLVVVTGMSGAGKTVAIQSFEDIGYFTIDNIPPSLVPKVIELLKAIVFDMPQYANERNHIQKIVQQHFWLLESNSIW